MKPITFYGKRQPAEEYMRLGHYAINLEVELSLELQNKFKEIRDLLKLDISDNHIHAEVSAAMIKTKDDIICVTIDKTTEELLKPYEYCSREYLIAMITLFDKCKLSFR